MALRHSGCMVRFLLSRCFLAPAVDQELQDCDDCQR
jgi:hypothetical protein